jgi:ribonuclease D
MPTSNQPTRRDGRRDEGPRREGGEAVPTRSRPYSRSDHRARNHESAHAPDATSLPDPGPAARHALVPRGEADLVTTNESLAALIEDLRAAGSFAYDSEFIGELTYFPKLCVIQVASVQRVSLIDPLAKIDLTPFWELLTDPAVEKIVHAGQQDIEPVVRHLGRAPSNVFDTQIAAGLAELPYPVSLSKLVNELTGARLGKGLTFTHWDQRPLSAMQLRYAADDVRYLPLVRQKLGEQLDSLGHAEWAREECAAQCDPDLYRFDPERQFLRVRGAGSLDPRNLAVLRALYAWRDAGAREADVPPRTFLKDEVLLDMARTPVKSADKLGRVKGLPRPVEAAHGKTIVETTFRAMSLPADQLPPAAREAEASPAEKFRSDALWVAAQCLCAGQGIDPALVASRQDLNEFWQALREGASTERHKIMTGWRREALGKPLTDLVSGSERFRVEWSEGSLRTESINSSA